MYYTTAPQDAGKPNTGSPATGDASWVVDDVANGGHWTNDNAWRPLAIKGPASTNFTFETFASGPSGRVIEMRLNGGASVVFDETDNKSVVQTFSGSTDSSGDALFEWRSHSTSGGATYLNAARLTQVVGPSVTADGDLQPGEPFVLTYADYTTIPATPVTIIDSDGNSITVPVVIDDTDTGGVHSGTASGTMPTLAELVSAGNGIKFETVTVELST